MVTQQPRRTHGRFNFLFYLVLTVTVAILLSRAAPRLSALFHQFQFGTRTSSSGPRPSINLPDSGALRSLSPLHTSSGTQSQTIVSQHPTDKYHLQSDKVSCYVK